MRSEFLLALEADAWHVVRIANDSVEIRAVARPTLADGDEPWRPVSAEAVAQVAAALTALGHKGQPVCLGLPSEMVLAGQVDCEGLPRKRRRQAMLFRLEEQLPLEAERLTADFLPPAAGRAMGLAVRTDRVRGILDLLGAAGIEISCICPTAMLALWDLLDGRPRQAGGGGDPDYLLLARPGGLDAFAMTDGQPVRWHTANGDASLLLGGIEADLLSRPGEGRRGGVEVAGQAPPDLVERLRASVAVEEVSAGADQEDQEGQEDWQLQSAARGAAALLAGKPAGWVDFRRDALSPGSRWQRLGAPLRLAGALALALVLTAGALMIRRAGRYEQVAHDHQDAQAAAFRKLYPNTPVPPSVLARLRSQAARLAGVSGTGHELPTQSRVLDQLRAILAHLPPSTRLRIVEIRVDAAGIFLEGQVRTHPDAQTLARALAQGGFAVEAPRTENLSAGGVSFTLAAKPPPRRLRLRTPRRLRLRKETHQP